MTGSGGATSGGAAFFLVLEPGGGRVQARITPLPFLPGRRPDNPAQ